jgi:1-deoxy-D-xylulose-5-phosphate synthase
MHKYLVSVQRNPLYNRLRSKIGEIADAVGGGRGGLAGTVVRKWEESFKAFLTPGVLFEELGFRYFGPVDGHDIDALVDTLAAVRELKGPRLVHVVTQKGRGFPAGENVEKWHALPPGHDPATGKQRTASTANPNYTAVFGKALTELGALDPRLAVITAAMPSGTGTGAFAKAFPQRFFDVGIAEGHAVTFAAGLATQGIKPVVAIYSTFLQRAYDNVIHDVALQHLPVVFAMDRAGWWARMARRTWGCTTSPTCSRCREWWSPRRRTGARCWRCCARACSTTPARSACATPATPPRPRPGGGRRRAGPLGTWEVPRRGRDVAVLAVGSMVGRRSRPRRRSRRRAWT